MYWLHHCLYSTTPQTGLLSRNLKSRKLILRTFSDFPWNLAPPKITHHTVLYMCTHFHAIIFAALTVANIRRVVQGLEWRRLGDNMLSIPDSILDEISKEHRADDQREAAVIHYWLLHDPLASWRRLIDRLHWWSEDGLANRISHYAEELTGTYTDYYSLLSTPIRNKLFSQDCLKYSVSWSR